MLIIIILVLFVSLTSKLKFFKHIISILILSFKIARSKEASLAKAINLIIFIKGLLAFSFIYLLTLYKSI